MKRCWTVWVGVALIAMGGLVSAQDEETVEKLLGLGDNAPEFKGLEWIQGRDPMDAEEKPDYLLVDCWATWCGPCVSSIPHMNELAAEYADRGVAVMGIAVWDEAEKVEAFVASGRNPMSYPIAIDGEGDVAENLMKASGQRGIPALFVLKATSREILWIGHPMMVDDILEKIVAGGYDIAKEKQRQAFQARLQQALEAKDWDDALTAVRDWRLVDEKEALTYELWIQAQRHDEQAACALLREIVVQDYRPEDAMRVMGLMGMILESFPDSEACRELAVQGATTVAGSAPDDAMVQGMYWFTLNADEQYEQAAEVADRLIEMNRDDKLELAGLAKSFLLKEMGERYVSQANRAVNRALELDPEFPPIWLYKLLLAAYAGDREVVQTYGRKILDQSPPDENLLNEAAWELMNDRRVQGEYNGLVLELAEKAELITNGENPAILDTLALAAFKNGDIERAIQLEKAAITAAPGYQALQMQLEMFEDALEAQKAADDEKTSEEE